MLRVITSSLNPMAQVSKVRDGLAVEGRERKYGRLLGFPLSNEMEGRMREPRIGKMVRKQLFLLMSSL